MWPRPAPFASMTQGDYCFGGGKGNGEVNEVWRGMGEGGVGWREGTREG